MPPRIAIPLPTSHDHDYNHQNWSTYAARITESGGIPVEFPLDLDDHALTHLAQSCQAILLPGSPADVDPASYGQPRDPASAPPDPARERTDRYLLEHAQHAGLPLFGICFGAQMLNVFRGGTLLQDLTPMPVNHSASRAVLTAHTAAIAPETLLATLIDEKETSNQQNYARLPINSSHHQAIGTLGANLVVSARCPQDAVIEAVEAIDSKRFTLGVQWHPERTAAISATSRNLFRFFIEQASL